MISDVLPKDYLFCFLLLSVLFFLNYPYCRYYCHMLRMLCGFHEIFWALKNQRGDPWKKKYFFQKSSLIYTRIGLKIPIFFLEIETCLKSYFGPCNIVNAPCTLYSVGGQRARSVHRVARAKIHFWTSFYF